MKIQTLAVIFIIIILPISIVLSSYTQNQIKTLNLQTSYNSKLTTATYDAVKAFQINSLNDSTSNVAASKIRDIEASVSTFFDSISDNFQISEGNKAAIKDYVPALVYTMYDGFYIYSPFENTLTDIEVKDGSTYPKGETLYGLKSYVYYSCRYKVDTESDFVITYSLDNYISIQGKVEGKNWNVSGYLLNGVKKIGENYQYNGITISKETTLKEFILDYKNQVEYIQINGTKYYKDDKGIFSIISGNKHYLGENTKQYYEIYFNSGDSSAYNYYKLAYEFTNLVRGNEVLNKLTFGNAVDENGNYPIKDNSGNTINGLSGNTKIFEGNIEDPSSNFNEHRTAVIRYSIQKNLALAIANFNDYSSSNNEFQMPNLSETDWYSIINNVSMISFMQGLSIGGKIYNGYSVVVNNKNKELVAEDSIYITTSDNQYHKPISAELKNKTVQAGEFNISFERRTYIDPDTKEQKYYFPKRHLGCYECIVNQPEVEGEYISTLQYINNLDKSYETLKKLYYTALGRERYSMYRVNYESYANNYKDDGNWKYIN